VDQAASLVDSAPGARADRELDQFVERRHHQRESGAEAPFGNVMVEDRWVYEEQWTELRHEHERPERHTRLEQWREFHLQQARSLSRTVGAMVRFHLDQAMKLNGGR
jgi:hypothetical protein